MARPHPFRATCVFSYPEMLAAMLARTLDDYPRIPCVMPLLGQHHPPRNGPANILHSSIPQAYGHWLRSVLADRPTLRRLPEPIVFIYACNEWAEGNHLDPDPQWGYGYLEETQRAFDFDRTSTSVETE